MEKVLYVSDLDGTLLDKADRINPQSVRIINDLISQGMLFTYATARSLSSASIVTKGLTANIPVIVYNGAFILNPSTGEVLSREGFGEAEMKDVRSVLERYNTSPLVYSFIDGMEKVSWVPGEENEGIRRYLDKEKGTNV